MTAFVILAALALTLFWGVRAATQKQSPTQSRRNSSTSGVTGAGFVGHSDFGAYSDGGGHSGGCGDSGGSSDGGGGCD
ncbi:hypothetical protein GS504_01510 [Rhodococcus hoagii]|nr:hypothetical protein [Prescottella equi]NKS71649.1 hypothetical protein [Prescottella equi]